LKVSNHNVILTLGYGWGEVVPDGFGVAYMVSEDCLMFNVAGLIGNSVPDLEDTPAERGRHESSTSPTHPSEKKKSHPGEVSAQDLLEDDPYFYGNYKKMRVQWLRSCLEEALDDLHQAFSNADKPAAESKEERPVLVKRKSSTKSKPVQVLTSTTQLPQSPTDEKSPSIHSTNTSNIGLSLAYPSRSELEGVIGEDVGYIEFEWGNSEQTHGSRSGRAGRSSTKKLVKKFLFGGEPE
jgi:hypothetical protein